MSIDGYTRIALQRRAALQLAERRAQQKAQAQIADLTARLCAPFAADIERFLDEPRRSLIQQVRVVEASLRREPEQALVALDRVETDWARAVTSAQASASAWSARRAACEAEVAAARARSSVVATHVGAIWAGFEETVGAAISRAASAAADGRQVETTVALAEVDAGLAAAEDAAREEAERKAAVVALIKTLHGMGFAVAAPRRHRDGDDRVVLEGRMPSGRNARFEVKLGGDVAFDLDGYPGTACKDEFDGIEAALLERFDVRMGPPQFVWKNPDRIQKGARDMPDAAPRPARKMGENR